MAIVEENFPQEHAVRFLVYLYAAFILRADQQPYRCIMKERKKVGKRSTLQQPTALKLNTYLQKEQKKEVRKRPLLPDWVEFTHKTEQADSDPDSGRATSDLPTIDVHT